MSDQMIPPQFLEVDQSPSSEPDLLIEQVKQIIGDDMIVEFTQVPRKPEREGALVLKGRLRYPSEELFPRWLKELNRIGYTPLLRPDPAGNDAKSVILRLMRGVAPMSESRWLINLILFIATLISTLFVGSQQAWAAGEIQIGSVGELFYPRNLASGLPFALTLLSILTAHEFGHYFAARYHNVAVTLPYFIPLPLPPFGTLGAFIRLKEPISDRRKLFDIGVAGPLAGLVLAVPLLFYGLSTSELSTLPPNLEGLMLEGNSIFYYTAKFLVFGEWLPNFIAGRDVLVNQVAFAAWAGLLVTALNLLPVGQLDGGHTVFALFGERAKPINIGAIVMMGGLAALGFFAAYPPVQQMFPWVTQVGFTGWFLWIFLILFVIGPFHPPALDDVTELDPSRRLIGYAILIIFILIFTPVPLRML